MNNQKYYSVEANHAGRLVDNAARNIENFLKKRAKALEVQYAYFLAVKTPSYFTGPLHVQQYVL